jgi:hypothetical protein
LWQPAEIRPLAATGNYRCIEFVQFDTVMNTPNRAEDPFPRLAIFFPKYSDQNEFRTAIFPEIYGPFTMSVKGL